MAMPSRKRIVLWMFLIFLVVFFGGIIAYLAPVLFGETTYDAQGNPVREISLFPFGDNTTTGSPIDVIIQDPVISGGSEVTDNETRGNDADRQNQLRLIDEGPVIGAYFYNDTTHSGLVGPATATTTDRDVENVFRYIELGTGHVFEGTTNTGEINRISNTTIPKIAEARFVNENRIIMRYSDATDRIKTFSAELVRNFAGSAGTAFKLQGIFLTDNILDLDISPSGKLLQVQSRIAGSDRASVIVSDQQGGNPVQVHASPVTEWLGSWNNQERVALLQSKPSYNTVSVAYTLDTQTGAFAPYILGRNGLSVTASTDLDDAVISVNENGATKLYAWNRTENQYIDLELSTFAEKCVHAAVRNKFYCAVPMGTVAEAEPDLWYQGVTSYSDQIWEIDPVTGRSNLLLLPIAFTEKQLDMIDLSISSDEQFLYFRDKRERSLWSFHIDYDVTSGERSPESELPPIGTVSSAEATTTASTTVSATTTVTEPAESFFE